MPERSLLDTAATAKALGVGDDRARQLGDAHGLVVARDSQGRRLYDADKVRDLAIARIVERARRRAS